MGTCRIFKRIAVFITIIIFISTISFIAFISLMRLDFRKQLDIPISKKERELFKEIEKETGFVADTTQRYIYKEECCDYEIVYNIEFHNKKSEKHIDDRIFKKQSLKFYNLLMQDETLLNLVDGNNMVIHIEYENNFYTIKILKEKHFLYHWNKKDTIFLK